MGEEDINEINRYAGLESGYYQWGNIRGDDRFLLERFIGRDEV